LAKITPTDQLILLDENGKHSSVGFSEELQKDELWRKTLVLGPYGFSDTVYSKHKERFHFR
jgi:23S rRNA (pseudouridine1915-N3)-methyltransferase